MTSRLRSGATPTDRWPVTLRSGDGRARVRPWWVDPSVAQLTFIDHGVVPTSTALRVWLSELRARGFTSVRTGAVTDAGCDGLTRQGFEVLQRLRLLDMSLIGWRPPTRSGSRLPKVPTRRLRVRERPAAAVVDRAAFGDAWAIDVSGIGETCTATPSHRARTVDIVALTGDAIAPEAGALAGYAVTGRADYTGYLQRLAVHPLVQGRGVGLGLTLDSLVWMQRRNLTRAVVNTHVENSVALRLYSHVGFNLLPQTLSVLVRRLDDV
ncbi:MAG TPA: GNAT family N-acetyltransferase [Ilumatobacteraceae bacterium]